MSALAFPINTPLNKNFASHGTSVQTLHRDDLPVFAFDKTVNPDLIMAMLEKGNKHLEKYYKGSGFIAPNCILDAKQPNKRHFQLFCDDVFLDSWNSTASEITCKVAS